MNRISFENGVVLEVTQTKPKQTGGGFWFENGVVLEVTQTGNITAASAPVFENGVVLEVTQTETFDNWAYNVV